jgi:hypothetical protein
MVACDKGTNIIDLPKPKGSLWFIRMDFRIVMWHAAILVKLIKYIVIQYC